MSQPAEPQDSSDVPTALPVLGYANPQEIHESNQTRVLARFSDAMQAHLAAAKVEAEGVRCQVVQRLDGIGVYGPHPAAAAIIVAPADWQVALAILAQTPARKFLVADPEELPPAKVLAPLSCPRCRSNDVGHPPRAARVIAGLIILSCLVLITFLAEGHFDLNVLMLYLTLSTIWAVIWLRDPPLRCRTCGHQWRATDPDLPDDDLPQRNEEP